MAAGRDLVSISRDVSQRPASMWWGMNVEPKALVDCFHHLYRRQNDANITNFLWTLAAPARVPSSPRPQLLLPGPDSIGGDHFNPRCGLGIWIEPDEPKLLRLKLCNAGGNSCRATRPRRPMCPTGRRRRGHGRPGRSPSAARAANGDTRRQQTTSTARPGRADVNTASVQAK